MFIHSCIQRTLIACNEDDKSSTSWGYKFFNSSLSPSASSSTILKLLKDQSGGLKHIGGLKSAEENLGLFQETLSRLAAEVGRRSSDRCQVTQLQLEPTSFEPGEGACRVFLIAIARKRCCCG